MARGVTVVPIVFKALSRSRSTGLILLPSDEVDGFSNLSYLALLVFGYDTVTYSPYASWSYSVVPANDSYLLPTNA